MIKVALDIFLIINKKLKPTICLSICEYFSSLWLSATNLLVPNEDGHF